MTVLIVPPLEVGLLLWGAPSHAFTLPNSKSRGQAASKGLLRRRLISP